MNNNEDKDRQEALDKLPHGVMLSWGLVKKAQRGPKGELNLAKIVEAAVTIADRDGLAAVSMSRVAESLGFTSMSLYRHISSKEDLLLLMQEAVCHIPIPPEREDGDWREGLREYVRACMKLFREHPWYGDIPITGIPLTPGNLRIIDWVLRSMKTFPLGDYEKLSLVLLLSGYARSFGLIQRDMERAMKAGAPLESVNGSGYGAALRHLVTMENFPYLFPIVHSGTYTGEHDSENEQAFGNDFEFGLERILDGIEHYVAEKLPKDPA